MKHEEGKINIEKASKWLKAAIALHEKHMDGSEPTTGKAGGNSQQKLMDMMMSALSALGGKTDKAEFDEIMMEHK